MSLLELERVGVRASDGSHERVLLRDVSMRMDAGELCVVWGLRDSGRSTLLRVAAGIDAPDEGVVRFAGRDLAHAGEETLGGGIGYCQNALAGWHVVLDQVMMSLLAGGVAPQAARARACVALDRAGVADCAARRTGELEGAAAMRVALARVLALQPRLLIVDEPIARVDVFDRDEIVALLRSLADEGVAVLASTGEAAALAGADRTYALSEGELRGPPVGALAPVLELHPHATDRASRADG